MKPGPKPGQYARPVAERFWEKVDRRGPDECWPWRLRRDAWGYGRFQESVAGGSRSSLAHRVSWMLANGPIPDGVVVRHSCDNPPCVNPAHLLLGTHADNMRDRNARGRVGPRAGEANGHARLREEDVQAIRRLAATTRRKDLAERFGVKVVTIQAILARRLWPHVS